MSIKNFVINIRKMFDTPEQANIVHLLKEERNKALQEAIDVCEMWKEECNHDLKEFGTLTGYGKINILNLCVQRIEEKITGVRRWDKGKNHGSFKR